MKENVWNRPEWINYEVKFARPCQIQRIYVLHRSEEIQKPKAICAHGVVFECFRFEIFQKAPNFLAKFTKTSINLIFGQKLKPSRDEWNFYSKYRFDFG